MGIAAERIHPLSKALRLVVNERLLPTGVVVSFLSKLFSLGGVFRVFNSAGAEIALVKGDRKGWYFQYLDSSGARLGSVTKTWAGIGKEIFTSADHNVIAFEAPDLPRIVTALLLAAGLAMDTVYKEK